MKKVLFSIILFLLAFSCTEEVFIVNDSVYKNSIENYFELLKTASPDNAVTIGELAQFVDFKKVTLMDLQTDEKLIIADLKENLPRFSKAEKMKVIFYLNNNEIIRSNLVSFENYLPFHDYNNLISSVLNFNGVGNIYSGKISFYATTDRRISLYDEFENGKLKTSGVARPRAITKTNGKTEGCLDWYLVIRYADGTSTATFLYTTCDGCQQTRYGRVELNCGGGGGSSSGGGGSSSASSLFPKNPQSGNKFSITDRAGNQTIYIYLANRWIKAITMLRAADVYNNSSPSFLSSVPNPYNNQVVSGPDGLLYIYQEANDKWIGSLIKVVGSHDPFATPIIDINSYMKCFDPTKSAKFTIYVDQPISGSSQCSVIDDPFNVGHTFLSIEQGTNARTIGFYPDGLVWPLSPTAPKLFKDNSGKGSDVSASFDISPQELEYLLDFIINGAPSDYDLNIYNCTDWVTNACARMGINLPQNDGTWLGGGGLCPGKFGEDMRNFSIPNRSVNNSQDLSAPLNKFNCVN